MRPRRFSQAALALRRTPRKFIRVLQCEGEDRFEFVRKEPHGCRTQARIVAEGGMRQTGEQQKPKAEPPAANDVGCGMFAPQRFHGGHCDLFNMNRRRSQSTTAADRFVNRRCLFETGYGCA